VSANPYESPRIVDAQADWPLAVPSRLLLILSALSALIWVIGGLNGIFLRGVNYVLYGILDIGLGVVNLLLCLGAWMTLRRKSRLAAWISAITALIPCLSPCIILGIPFGIWLIVLLKRPHVISPFDQVEEPTR
jgi:hypothetical protein